MDRFCQSRLEEGKKCTVLRVPLYGSRCPMDVHSSIVFALPSPGSPRASSSCYVPMSRLHKHGGGPLKGDRRSHKRPSASGSNAPPLVNASAQNTLHARWVNIGRDPKPAEPPVSGVHALIAPTGVGAPERALMPSGTKGRKGNHRGTVAARSGNRFLKGACMCRFRAVQFQYSLPSTPPPRPEPMAPSRGEAFPEL